MITTYARIRFTATAQMEAWAMVLVIATALPGCTFDVSGFFSPCGNGKISGTEQCDATDLGGESCQSLNLGGGVLHCNSDCTFDTSGCELTAICGNGTREGGEQCDDGNTLDGDGCDHLCRIEGNPSCGNGTVDPGEECDDGNSSNLDACLNDCSWASCGDGFVRDGVEICDPEGLTETCETLGLRGGTLFCRPDCTDYDLTQCLSFDGQQCTEDWQCEGNLCFKEDDLGYPGGYCTRDCSSTYSCPGDSACLNAPVGWRCFERCTTTADCRPGYGCFLDPFESAEWVCRPHCEADDECPVTGHCNLYLGRCNQASPGSGAIGDACGAGECLGICWTQPTGGYCTSLCELSTGLCPENGLCADAYGGTAADLGLCLKRCSGGDDCPRFFYSCQDDPFGSGQSVCWDWL